MNAPDPYLRYASSSYPIGGFVLLDRLLCRCEGRCECDPPDPDDDDEAD